MVRIRPPYGLMATIEGYRWSAEDPCLAETLQGMLVENGPAGDDPDPDHTAAMAAVRRLGGVIEYADEDDDECSGDLIY